MEHYVTLFDSLFLPQGLALHRSLERHCQPYKLWILCVDGDTFDVLGKLALPNVQLLPLEKLETDELRRVKPLRTKREYCWTLTPFAPRFVFEADSTVQRVTYLDADVWFRKTPLPIFREFDDSGKHVLITEHGYAPEYDQSATSGKYCVQFVTFTRTGGTRIRQWWEECCIDWCYARFENNKFGDQKYLDDWPVRFPREVHVLADERLMLGPWNAARFTYEKAILYHFQGLRLNRHSVRFSPEYHLPAVAMQQLYEPYVNDLRSASRQLLGVRWDVIDQIGRRGTVQRLVLVMKEIKRLCEKVMTAQSASI